MRGIGRAADTCRPPLSQRRRGRSAGAAFRARHADTPL